MLLDQMVALNLTGMLEAWKGLTEQDPGEALDRNEWLGPCLPDAGVQALPTNQWHP